MKIAYCIEGLFNSGGMERIVTVKANYLAQHGYDVTLITSHQEGKPFAFFLDEKIHHKDLNVDFSIKRSLWNNATVSDYRKKLNDYLLTKDFDIVISTGGMDLYELYKIKDGSIKLAEVHFSYDMNYLMAGEHASQLKTLFVAFLKTKRMVMAARHYKNIVVLTKRDLNKWRRHCTNAIQIYNPVTIEKSNISKGINHRAIAVGRLAYQKGFDYLVKAWRLVHAQCPEWNLSIFGEGPDRDFLQNLIHRYGLSACVSLKGNSRKIQEEYAKSSLFIMSSRFEGFPLSMIEAESSGLPVVSYDCPCGPSELIDSGRNGLLVSSVGDVDGLANAIIDVLKDERKRKAMADESLRKVMALNVDEIMGKWMLLFSEVLKQKA